MTKQLNSYSKAHAGHKAICNSATIFSLGLLFAVTLFEHYLTGIQLFFFVFLFVSLSGAILDQSRWIFYLEYIRILLVLIAIAVFYPDNWAFSSIITALMLLTW